MAIEDDILSGITSPQKTELSERAKEYLSVLNPEQYEAVVHEGSPLLILAGAGSGKTRVITTKIAYLIGEKGVNPHSILAVTFTKKAANEMHERAILLEEKAQYAQIRTFHSFGAWFLRVYAEDAVINPNFTVYDDDDMVSLLQKVDPKFTKKEAATYAKKISLAKDFCLLPTDPELQEREEFLEPADLAEVYALYEERLRGTGNVDFGDLILLPYLALRENAFLREKMYRRFRVILVDEYQDSNVAQFKLLEALSGLNEGSGTYVCVVGDDDQSIYKFRGADVRNILNFQKIFRGTKIVRLESNYRSTPEILALADNVVRNNSSRLGKTLRAERESGKTPVLAFLPNHNDEVQFCAEIIQKSHETGVPYSDWAILYRTNAQSGGFESEFIRRKIPYTIVGAQKFLEREEVKDILAYLELLVNHKNEIAFQRIVNKPARSIGAKTQDKIIESALTDFESGNFEKGDTISASRYMLKNFIPKVKSGLNDFIELMDELESLLNENEPTKNQAMAEELFSDAPATPENSEKSEIVPPLPENSENLENSGTETTISEIEKTDSKIKNPESKSEKSSKNQKNLAYLIEKIAKKSGLEKYYEARDREDHTFRVENIQALATNVAEYRLNREDLLSFLDGIQLERAIGSSDEEITQDSVTLITLHNTKGLEFNRVIMTGMEEGIFPRNADDKDEMEEERRLCYVGITRARNELYFTSCSLRRLFYGEVKYMKISPFLLEMGSEGVKVIGHAPSSYRGSKFYGGDYGERGLSHPDLETDSIKKKYARGTRIYHDDYGYGIIANTMTNDEGEYAITVSFENSGIKRFLPKYQESQLMVVKE